MTNQIEHVDPQSLRPDSNQPRRTISETEVESLARNFLQKGVGVINPIEADDNNVIVTGELRWRAALKAGLSTIPLRRHIPETDSFRYLRQVSENILHSTLSAYDKGMAFQDLLERQGAGDFETGRPASSLKPGPRSDTGGDQGIRTLAGRLGCTHSIIREHLALIRDDTPEPLREAVKEGRVEFKAARAVATRTPKEYRLPLAEHVVSEAAKGKVTGGAVERVAVVLRQAPDKPTAKRVIHTIEAGQSLPDTERKLAAILPSLSDELSGALLDASSFERLLAQARDALNGRTIDEFPKSRRNFILQVAQDLGEAVREFVASADSLPPRIEGHVLSDGKGT